MCAYVVRVTNGLENNLVIVYTGRPTGMCLGCVHGRVS
ncbi:hypothetical protein F383_13861 [Gossypium arboreum]|uniref:Uncharacterized protein n=1 Tax=Gossypium arboreum TaxID=29729 RepID=A0A0B0NAR1_GOSAR|nr:hypothetical protein F383_13861 [Gossypium arboreum]